MIGVDLKEIVKPEEDGFNFSVDVKRLKRLARRKDISEAPFLKWTDIQELAIVGIGRIRGLEQGCYVDRKDGKWALLAGLKSSQVSDYINQKCPNGMRYIAVACTDIEEMSFNLRPYLRELWLIDNPKLHNVSGLENLTGLQIMRIRQERLDSELDLSKMWALEELDLQRTALGEIKLDQQLKYLKKCDLRDTEIEDRSFLDYCPALEWLAISDDDIPLLLNNPQLDMDGLTVSLQNTLSAKSDGNDDSFRAAMKIADSYKEWIEYHRGAKVIQDADSQSREKTVQYTIHLAATEFCRMYNWDFSPEVDSGRGPVDFKISRGNDKTVVEVKLTSNAQCVHGLEVQIEEYARAEATDKKVFLLVNTGQGENRIEAVEEKRKEMLSAGKHPAEVVVIDARPKKAASTHQ